MSSGAAGGAYGRPCSTRSGRASSGPSAWRRDRRFRKTSCGRACSRASARRGSRCPSRRTLRLRTCRAPFSRTPCRICPPISPHSGHRRRSPPPSPSRSSSDSQTESEGSTPSSRTQTPTRSTRSACPDTSPSSACSARCSSTPSGPSRRSRRDRRTPCNSSRCQPGASRLRSEPPHGRARNALR